MNENLDRLLHGWHPRKDAGWFWWVLADTIILCLLIRSLIQGWLVRPTP